MSRSESGVVIGMDPHKRSVTIEVMAADEAILGGGRFDTDAAGYRSLVRYARQRPEQTRAIEGCQGIGKHVAIRLLADDEAVVDVLAPVPTRRRGDWQTEVASDATMTADETTFHVTSVVEGFEGPERGFSKTWTFAIPRDGV